MKITDTEFLGACIRKKREQLNYTQIFVSENTGLSVSFISEVENGKPTAQLGKVLMLMQVLGLDLIVEDR